METHEQGGMEGFQAKENTFVGRKAKESLFEVRQEAHEADHRGLGQLFIYR